MTLALFGAHGQKRTAYVCKPARLSVVFTEYGVPTAHSYSINRSRALLSLSFDRSLYEFQLLQYMFRSSAAISSVSLSWHMTNFKGELIPIHMEGQRTRGLSTLVMVIFYMLNTLIGQEKLIS